MSGNILDFSGIPEYQINNLHIVSMGHISEKAIRPVWTGMPMTGTELQYVPLGYIATNGLGEKLMYCKFAPTAAKQSIVATDLTGALRQCAVYWISPDDATYLSLGYESFTFNLPAIVSPLTTAPFANGVVFYAGFDATNVYGWVRLAFSQRDFYTVPSSEED
jgi:hypothetical protein